MPTGDLSRPLQRSAALHADRIAVVDGERSVAYGALACAAWNGDCMHWSRQ